MSNHPPTGRRFDVLHSGAAARRIAHSLGFGLCEALPAAGSPPVVVVVTEPSEVDALTEVDDRSWIGCVIAWQLPEAALERLYELGVAVFVGLPDAGSVLQAFDYPPDAAQVSAARHLAARLASIEALLGDG